MPDLDLRGFDRDTVAAAVHQPSLSELRRRAARRRRLRPRLPRKRGAALATLVAMVVAPLGAGAVALVPGRSAPATTDVAVSQLVVLDAATAVGILNTDDACTPRFTATVDGGQTWSPLRGPGAAAEPCPAVPDVRHLVLGPRTFLVQVDDRSYLTTDAGATWDAKMTTVDSFPAGARPVGCGADCLSMPEPLAVAPSGETVYRLRSAGIEYPIDKMYVAPDGALWGYVWGDGWIVRSVDRGATWRTYPVPVSGGRSIGIAARSGTDAYLLVSTADGLRLMRTTDGGTVWQTVATDLPAAEHQRALAVAADGAIVVGDSSGVWLSTDGGRHFVRNTARAGDGTAGSASGWLWTLDHAGESAHVTDDGRAWRTILLPPS